MKQNSATMKYSGVNWIGNMPDSWQVLPIRAILNERKEKNTNGNKDNILSVMKNVGVIRYADKGNVGNKSSDRPENYKVVYKNDIVVNSMNLVIGSVGLANENGVTSSVYIIYYLRDKNNDIRYYYDLFRSKSFQRHLGTYGKGIMELRESIKVQDIKNQLIPIPPPATQKRIADFLDEKTVKIDQIIAKKKKLIKLLKELRISIITKAVTKGLDPKAKMKPSGVEWIGDIPEGWVAIKSKFIGKAIIGMTYAPGDEVSEDGTLVLRASNIREGKILLNDNVYIKKDIPDKLRTRVGDILICSRSGSKNLIGKCALIDKDSKNITFGAFMTVYRSQSWKYIYYLLNSTIFTSQTSLFTTSTINQLTVNTLDNMFFILPPDSEQKEIIEYLEKQLRKLDDMLSKTNKQLILFEKYRSSLIYNAVTGKIK